MQEEQEKFKITKVEKFDDIIETAEERERLLKKYLIIAALGYFSNSFIDTFSRNASESVILLFIQVVALLLALGIETYSLWKFAKGILVDGDIPKLLETCLTDLKDVIKLSNDSSIEKSDNTIEEGLHRIK